MTTATTVQGEIIERKGGGYSPLAPVGDAMGLKRLLDASKAGIAQALPRHITPERLIKTLLVAANRTPDLLHCTQASILETINRAAELGLDLSGTLGEAYAVPFNNKVKDQDGREVWAKQATLIIGYRGLAKLAWQSGEIKRIEAEVVYEGDHFVFRKGLNGTLEFEPDLMGGDRGKPIGAYALVEMKSGGVQYDFLSRTQIEAVRAKAQSKNSPAWTGHWDEMARKTVFRRLAKWLPLSTEKFTAAIEHDNTSDAIVEEVLAVEADSRPRSQQLLERLSENDPVSETAPQTADVEPVESPNREPTKLSKLGQQLLDEIKQAAHHALGVEGNDCTMEAGRFLQAHEATMGSLDDRKVRERLRKALETFNWEA